MTNRINNVQMFEGDFKGQRTAYSSSSIFIAVLCSKDDSFYPDLLGEKIFPDGFGTVEPPGPSFGFGPIFLSESEQSGLIAIESLDERLDDEGNKVSKEAAIQALEEYFDAHFIVDRSAKKLVQISFKDFKIKLQDRLLFSQIQLLEFEPDE